MNKRDACGMPIESCVDVHDISSSSHCIKAFYVSSTLDLTVWPQASSQCMPRLVSVSALVTANLTNLK